MDDNFSNHNFEKSIFDEVESTVDDLEFVDDEEDKICETNNQDVVVDDKNSKKPSEKIKKPRSNNKFMAWEDIKKIKKFANVFAEHAGKDIWCVPCECTHNSRRSDMDNHLRTKKHKDAVIKQSLKQLKIGNFPAGKEVPQAEIL